MWTYLHQIVASAIHGADGGGLLKDSGDFWVHLDVQIVLHGPLLVPLVDSGINPIGEGLADDGEDDIGDVLSRQLLQFRLHQR